MLPGRARTAVLRQNPKRVLSFREGGVQHSSSTAVEMEREICRASGDGIRTGNMQQKRVSTRTAPWDVDVHVPYLIGREREERAPSKRQLEAAAAAAARFVCGREYQGGGDADNYRETPLYIFSSSLNSTGHSQQAVV